MAEASITVRCAHLSSLDTLPCTLANQSLCSGESLITLSHCHMTRRAQHLWPVAVCVLPEPEQMVDQQPVTSQQITGSGLDFAYLFLDPWSVFLSFLKSHDMGDHPAAQLALSCPLRYTPIGDLSQNATLKPPAQGPLEGIHHKFPLTPRTANPEPLDAAGLHLSHPR